MTPDLQSQTSHVRRDFRPPSDAPIIGVPARGWRRLGWQASPRQPTGPQRWRRIEWVSKTVWRPSVEGAGGTATPSSSAKPAVAPGALRTACGDRLAVTGRRIAYLKLRPTPGRVLSGRCCGVAAEPVRQDYQEQAVSRGAGRPGPPLAAGHAVTGRPSLQRCDRLTQAMQGSRARSMPNLDVQQVCPVHIHTVSADQDFGLSVPSEPLEGSVMIWKK